MNSSMKNLMDNHAKGFEHAIYSMGVNCIVEIAIK